jgi:biopolymer transport protein ExbD
MVFILLIFFIVTTVFVEEEGMEVTKPEPAASNSLDNETIVFTVTSAGQVKFQDQILGEGGVAATVTRLTRREKLPVIVDVQQRSLTNLLVRVIDEARSAGAENVSLTSSN